MAAKGSVVSQTWVAGSVNRTAAATALTAVFAIGCATEDSCSSASEAERPDLAMGSLSELGAAAAICAAGVEYRGRFYIAWSAKLPVAKGHLLGDAVYPACNDGGGYCRGDEPVEPDRPTQVWAMRGVHPGRIVVARREGTNRFQVFGRENADPAKYFRFAGGTWHIRDGLTRGR
jgi:Family of unknown function (DUF6281)